MAPSCPEEVDVFTVPHSRMKELVCKYLDMLTATNFSSPLHLTKLLENLIKTFQEFIAHEQIENQFIMKKLKNKLRSLSIQNSAVCNCHKDNRLTEMLKFLQDGYKCTKKSELDRHNYGLQLRRALEDFTETFLPHMEEEEEVFQPLLMQHFTFEELKQIKATVIQQHFKAECEEVHEKYLVELKSCKPVLTVEKPVTRVNDVGIENLPDEVLLKVFSHLNPQERCRVSQVSRRWNSLAMDGTLWTELYPVSWAKGDWNATSGVDEEDTISVEEKLNSKAFDEDADIDEADDWDEEAREIQHQSKMLTLMCKHLLPRVGRTIKHCDLAYSKGLTNGTLYKILSLCPNLEYLDLTQTRISDLGFKGFKKSSCGRMLRHLDLSGCLYITDLTLQRLSAALGHLPCHMTGSERHMSDHVTQGQMTDVASVEEECSLCKENRKNEEQDRGGEIDNEKKSCNTMKSMFCVSKNGHLENGKDEGKIPASQEEFKEYNCGTRKCCDTRTGCNEKSRKHPNCRCCHGNTKKEEKFAEQDAKRPFEHQDCNKAHDIQLDNGNKDSQDRSWIKQGHCCQGQRSRTLNDDHLPGNKGKLESDTSAQQDQWNTHDEYQKFTKVDSQKCTYVNRQIASDRQFTADNSPNKAIIPGYTEFNNKTFPEQTSLPEFILQSWLFAKHVDTPNMTENTKDIDMVLPVGPENQTGIPLTQQRVPVGIPPDQQGVLVGIPKVQQEGPEGKELWSRSLESLSLSGCYQITDTGLNYLTDSGGLPRLDYLDLSGCLNLSGDAVSRLVSTAPVLNPTQLFYCDNILDGPYADTASGCQNLQCGSRVCCRCGE